MVSVQKLFFDGPRVIVSFKIKITDRKTRHSFAPRSQIFKLQQEV